MRVLITGGQGYIGARLAVYLAKSNFEVTIASRKPIVGFFGKLPIKQKLLIWSNQKNIDDICNKIDVVVHAAGPNARHCEANVLSSQNVTSSNIARLIKSSKNAGVERFIYLSTAHVYMSRLKGEITESLLPSNHNPYAVNHLIAEKLLSQQTLRSGEPPLILRVSNAFGIPVNECFDCWGLVANNFCRSAVENGKIIIKGQSNEVRNFIPMMEFCSIMEQLITLRSILKTKHILNIGGHNSFTLGQLAQLVATRCNWLSQNKPNVEIKNSTEDKVENHLEYKSDYLSYYGVTTKDFFISEIDNLLLHCKRNF